MSYAWKTGGPYQSRLEATRSARLAREAEDAEDEAQRLRIKLRRAEARIRELENGSAKEISE